MTFLIPNEWSEVVNAEGLAEHNNTFPLEDGELEIYTLPNHAFLPDQRRIPGANPMEAKKSCRAETDRPCVYDVF